MTDGGPPIKDCQPYEGGQPKIPPDPDGKGFQEIGFLIPGMDGIDHGILKFAAGDEFEELKRLQDPPTNDFQSRWNIP